jgi:mRNA-degrading endonuclease toxin of MazEF toxin-antitoxin module
VIKCAEIYTFWKHDLTDVIGTLPPTYVDQVNRALATALDLPRLAESAPQ